MNQLTPVKINHALAPPSSGSMESTFVTVTIADQLFGIPVMQVRDILGVQRLTRLPLAPPEISGVLNLRGKVVTVIDLRTRLGLPPRPSHLTGMNVVVEHEDELYSLVTDNVGEVLNLPDTDYEKPLGTLDPRWQAVASGIYRLSGRLLVVLDVTRLLQFRM
jgi:purine-binding chemotaxis protein CheW